MKKYYFNKNVKKQNTIDLNALEEKEDKEFHD